MTMTDTATAGGFFKYPRWLLDMVTTIRSRTMRDAADIYMLMLNRASLSARNGFVDKDNHIYIHFTYKEVKELFGYGTTKTWMIFKQLKDKGLITVKHQGFGLPMMIYVHGAVVINSSDTSVDKLKAAVTVHTEICDGTFDDRQIAKIYSVIDEIAPKTALIEEKTSFISTMYNKLVKVENERTGKENEIKDRFSYFLSMLSRAVYKPTAHKLQSNAPPTASSPSFDLSLIMERAKNSKPKI